MNGILKSCPFCKGEAKIWICQMEGEKPNGTEIRCKVCAASLRETFLLCHPDNESDASELAKTRTKVIAAWNKQVEHNWIPIEDWAHRTSGHYPVMARYENNPRFSYWHQFHKYFSGMDGEKDDIVLAYDLPKPPEVT